MDRTGGREGRTDALMDGYYGRKDRRMDHLIFEGKVLPRDAPCGIPASFF